jgi:hypothetical protein
MSFSSIKVLKILKGLGGILSRSGKMLSTFKFWLELNMTQGVKAKHCWALSTNFLFSVKLTQSKAWFSQ